MANPPTTIVILHGAVAPDAPADEQDVLAEAAAVRAVLERQGWCVHTVPMGLDLEAALAQIQRVRPALVFNLVEAVAGRGQLISLGPLLLEHAGISYTGAPLEALFVTSSKVLTKQALQRAGLPTPAWAVDAAPQGDGPWIVKSQWEHASIGLDDSSIMNDRVALMRHLVERRERFGGAWFVERFVDGREFNVAIIESPGGLRVLPVAEIVFEGFPPDKPRIVGYRAKWEAESFEYHHTQRRFVARSDEPALVDTLERIALQCWSLFELRGYARVDVRVDADGVVWVLEVNANPCLSPDAGLAAAAAQAGLGYDTLVMGIVEAAIAVRSVASTGRALGCGGVACGSGLAGRDCDAQCHSLSVAAPLPLPPEEPDATPAITFRDDLRRQDIEPIIRLVAATDFFHDHEIAVARELLDARLARGAPSGYEFVIAEVDGRVVGYTCFGEVPCTQGGYDVYWIVVAPQWQGRGIGQALLHETERRVRGAGGRQLYIETSSRPLYEPTRRFYLKSGYRQAAFFEDFYAPGDGKLVYRKVVT